MQGETLLARAGRERDIEVDVDEASVEVLDVETKREATPAVRDGERQRRERVIAERSDGGRREHGGRARDGGLRACAEEERSESQHPRRERRSPSRHRLGWAHAVDFAAKRGNWLRGPLRSGRVGHFCRFCGRSRPNERFSGGGHRDHVCRDCENTFPLEERQAMDALGEITGFLHDQSRISPKNVERLTELATWKDADVAEQAAVMLEVARFAPGKSRRLQRIRASRPELWQRLIEVGLLYPSNAREEVWAALGAGLSSEELDFEDDEPGDDEEPPF